MILSSIAVKQTTFGIRSIVYDADRCFFLNGEHIKMKGVNLHHDGGSTTLPFLEALDIVARTAGNKIIEGAIFDVRSGISEGRTMADPLTESGIFPPMVCQMIAVGESTGALDQMLEKIADFYDEEVDQAVENLTALIEPFMLVFLGATIGGLVVSMYLPVFKMAGGL